MRGMEEECYTWTDVYTLKGSIAFTENKKINILSYWQVVFIISLELQVIW